MKRYIALFVVALMLVGSAVAWAQPTNKKQTSFVPKGPSASCLFESFKPFSEKVWRLSKWEIKEPKPIVIEALHKRLGCAPPNHRKAMKAKWLKDKKHFYEFRGNELFRVRITPFSCNGGWWATPCEIPLHESGYCTGGTNCYGMLDAWYLHGCTEFASSGFGAPMRAQHICAHRHYATYGRGGWPSY